MKKSLLLAFLLTLSTTVSAKPTHPTASNVYNKAMSKAVSKALGGCDRDWIPGNCILRAYKAYKVGKVAGDIAQIKFKRKKAQKRKARRTIKKAKKVLKFVWRYNPASMGRKLLGKIARKALSK